MCRGYKKKKRNPRGALLSLQPLSAIGDSEKPDLKSFCISDVEEDRNERPRRRTRGRVGGGYHDPRRELDRRSVYRPQGHREVVNFYHHPCPSVRSGQARVSPSSERAHVVTSEEDRGFPDAG